MNSRDGNVQSVMSQDQLVAKLEKQTAPKIHPDDLTGTIKEATYYVFPGSMLTVCMLTLNNGFTVTGESACASPENFNEEIGRTIAHRNAKDKLWSLLGYELKTKLAMVEAANPSSMKDADVRTYVGTKVVHAGPMSRSAYNAMHGWALPQDENGEDAGYLVEYADGGQPNVRGFAGYVSWSPKDVFERAYNFGVGKQPSKVESFYDRLVAEMLDLKARHEKLVTFLQGKDFRLLAEVDQTDLRNQEQAMNLYLDILEKRAARMKRYSIG